MTMRLLVAGVLGAVAMFFWSFIAHMCFPSGMLGSRSFPTRKQSSPLSRITSEIIPASIFSPAPAWT